VSADTIRVTHGDPTPEELAALIGALAVLAAQQRGTDESAAGPHWRRPDRIPGHRGPRSWRQEPIDAVPTSLPVAA
jgi:hypothetical protein